MEQLKIYKDLVQCHYKEPANGNIGDCTKEVLANLHAEENSIQRKGASQKQCKVERYFQLYTDAVPNI